MDTQALKQLMVQGLGALKSGAEISARASDEIENDATNPELKAALKQGAQTSAQWVTRIDQALQEAGGGGQQQDNPIMQAHNEVAKRTRAQATESSSRDLGIIAAAQLALHSWIASFGTLQAYAKRAGLPQTEQAMAQSLGEAKQADEQMTALAIRIMA